MKRLGLIFLPLVLCAAILGCGGAGGGLFGGGNDVSSNNDEALVNSLDRSFHDINTQNLSDLDNIDLASNFFDDCFTRDQFLNHFDTVFNDPSEDYTITVDRIVDVNRTSTTRGTVTYDWTSRDTINGSTTTTQGTTTDLFVKEGGEWRWAGNQDCPSGRSTGKVWRGK
ncbi:MAG: hypothetical protein QOJ65_367 [Fimbriimonadaceae bacterium]|jgi:hypothetical protein|nr:hypothetical protein [Fimbriimonadaceae bacterium]